MSFVVTSLGKAVAFSSLGLFVIVPLSASNSPSSSSVPPPVIPVTPSNSDTTLAQEQNQGNDQSAGQQEQEGQRVTSEQHSQTGKEVHTGNSVVSGSRQSSSESTTRQESGERSNLSHSQNVSQDGSASTQQSTPRAKHEAPSGRQDLALPAELKEHNCWTVIKDDSEYKQLLVCAVKKQNSQNWENLVFYFYGLNQKTKIDSWKTNYEFNQKQDITLSYSSGGSSGVSLSVQSSSWENKKSLDGQKLSTICKLNSTNNDSTNVTLNCSGNSISLTPFSFPEHWKQRKK